MSSILQIRHEAGGRYLLGGSIDLASVVVSRDNLINLLNSNSGSDLVEISFGEVRCQDISLIVMVLGLVRFARDAKIKLKFIEVGVGFRKMLDIYGLTDLDSVINSL